MVIGDFNAVTEISIRKNLLFCKISKENEGNNIVCTEENICFH